MPAPSREDLDKAIDKTAEDLVRLANEGGAFVSVTSGGTTAAVSAAAACMSADALTLSALLAYRADARVVVDRAHPVMPLGLDPDGGLDQWGRTPEEAQRETARKPGGAS